MQESITFPSGTVHYYFNSSFQELSKIVQGKKIILLMDSNVHAIYKSLFQAYDTIVIPAGEKNKTWESIHYITEQLIHFKADRKTLLIGAGGGMITDVTGFAASVYMRGIGSGFIPTTLLCMVDAAIGGKNGINFDLFKNMLGTIRQPEFLIYDTSFLQTLTSETWSSGFAEVIKYGCIFDSFLFENLLEHDVNYFNNNEPALQSIIQKCVSYKNKIVLEDEQEQGIRKLLNFGHTVGHAVEKIHEWPHGYAISIGMIIACIVSEEVAGLNTEVKKVLVQLLKQYDLPTTISLNIESIMSVLKMDKKRNKETIDFIVLEKIGQASIKNIPFHIIYEALVFFSDGSDY